MRPTLQNALAASIASGLFLASAMIATAQVVPKLTNSRIGFHVIRTSGIQVDIRNLGGSAIEEPVQPGSTVFIQYDDGYIGTDQRNWPGETSNWGYTNASQVNGTDITMNQALSTNSWDQENFGDDNTTGFGINTHGQRGEFTIFAGINWFPVKAESSHVMNLSYSSIADTYTYKGATPPAAPHSGQYTDTTHILDMNGTRQYNANAGTDTISGTRTVDGLLHQIHIGTQFKKKAYENLFIGAGVAVTANIFNVDFDISQQIVRDGVQISSYDRSRSETDLSLGLSAGGSIAYELRGGNMLYVEWQKQFASDTELSHNTGETASISFEDFHNLNVGFSFPF